MSVANESEVGRCIFREAHDAIMLIEPGSLAILDANPSALRLSGYRRKELTALRLAEVVECPPGGLHSLQKACGSTSCFASGDGFFVKTSKGEKTPIHVRVSRIHTEPKPLGLLIAWDVTRQKQAEDERHKIELQMQQSQRLESLGVMAGGVAHDFNNLLTGIMGNAELACFDLPEGSPVRHNMSQIIGTTHRASELVRQLLAYSGHSRVEMRPLRLSNLVREIGQLLRVSISKNVAMSFSLADDGPVCLGDAAQLSQVIMNLVVNAAEAIGAKPGVVCLSSRVEKCNRELFKTCYLNDPLPEGEYVCLEVSDTGCGMDTATMARIFDPFFTTKFTGRGLGLAAVLGIVRSHSGAIQIESHPGRGTRFRVYLPSSHEPVREPQAPVATKSDWRGHGLILVVDDEESVRYSAREMLERMGFEVALATDGVEGLQAYREKREIIRAVMLDLAMPRMNGADLARELRRLGATVPVIVASGFDEHAIHKAFGPAEMTAFIQKPYRYQDLQLVFSKFLPAISTDPRKTGRKRS